MWEGGVAPNRGLFEKMNVLTTPNPLLMQRSKKANQRRGASITYTMYQ